MMTWRFASDPSPLAKAQPLRSLVGSLALIGLSVLTVVGALEFSLRLYPGLINEEVLLEFERDLRQQVAARLDLPIKENRRCIPSAERYDRGPELCLMERHQVVHFRVDPIDRGHGARVTLPHDANGFCNPSAAAMQQNVDLLTVGDSFTWCTGVAPTETFTALLQQRTSLSTYNLGLPGIGPHEYVELLRRFGLAMQPAIVIMNIYEGNDLRDGLRYRRHLEKAAIADPPKAPAPWQIWAVGVVDQSYAINFLGAAIEVIWQGLRSRPRDFLYEVSVAGSPVTMNVADADRDELDYARALEAGEVDLKVWAAPLKAFAELGRRERFRAVVMYTPSAHTAYGDRVRFSDPTAGEAISFMSAAQRHQLGRLALEYGLAFIDATEYLQNEVQSSALAYFPANLHLTQAGHDLLATLMATEVAKLRGEGGAATTP